MQPFLKYLYLLIAKDIYGNLTRYVGSPILLSFLVQNDNFYIPELVQKVQCGEFGGRRRHFGKGKYKAESAEIPTADTQTVWTLRGSGLQFCNESWLIGSWNS